MAGTTTNYAFPYPSQSDSPAGGTQIQALATAVDTALDGVDDRLDTAEATIVSNTSNISAVTTTANAARVRKGKTTATSNSSATSGTTELSIDQVTISAVNGKTYRIEWFVPWTGSSAAAGERFFLLLRLGSGTGGTQLTFMTVVVKDTGATEAAYVVAEWTASSTASQTFTASMRRSNGSGTITANGSATQPRLLTVDQV